MANTAIEWGEYDKGWIESFIEAKGSLSLITEERPHYQDGITWKPMMHIANTSLELMKNVQRILGGKILTRRIREDWQIIHYLQYYSNSLRIILPKLKLLSKEKQRVLLIEALEILSKRSGSKTSPQLGSSRLVEILYEIRKLNKKFFKPELKNILVRKTRNG